MNSNIFCWMIFIWLASCTCELICPTAEIGSPVELICNHPQQTSTWVRLRSPSTAEASCTPICSGSERFNIRVVNKTQSRLTVLSVETGDEGEWRCKYGQEAEESVTCNMHLYKIPTCHVESDKATSVVSAGETVIMSLAVNNSYCTNNNVFTFQTGQVEQNLTGQKHEIVSHTFNVTFNASENYFGNVSTTFSCRSQHSLNCSGVSKLMQRERTSYPEFPLYGILLLSAAILIVSITVTAILIWKHPEWRPCNILDKFKTKSTHTDK